MDFGPLYDTLREMARAGLSAEEAMEALAAELTETSLMSSISRPRVQEYKDQGPKPKTRCGRPWSSWGSFLACQLSRTNARTSPKMRFDRPGQT